MLCELHSLLFVSSALHFVGSLWVGGEWTLVWGLVVYVTIHAVA
jgi:hypothetical protein